MANISPKSKLQAAISTGHISSVDEAVEMAMGLGLRVTRRGLDYAGFLDAHGHRFRVRFAQKNHASPIRGHGFWFYVLIARSSQGVDACYIGQTVHLKRRMREHLARQDGGRASSQLFRWAHDHKTDVFMAPLLWSACSNKDAMALEAFWQKLAMDAGLELPAIERWLQQAERFPHSEFLPNQWPADLIDQAKVRLTELMQTWSEPEPLYTLLHN